MRLMLKDEMKGSTTTVIVLGDINDGQMSNTANILTDQPRLPGGRLARRRRRGPVHRADAAGVPGHRDVYYTHVHQDFRESLDHILVSEQLYDNSRKRKWLFDGLVINNDHLNFDDHKESGTSDHGVVKVSF